MRIPSRKPKFFDLIIIGGGPAGLTAALYAARAGIKVAVFEKAGFGGALLEIDKISNYPGFSPAPGKDLADTMRAQAIAAGAELFYGDCTLVEPPTDQPLPDPRRRYKRSSELFYLTIDNQPYSARAVLVATGTEPRHLPEAPSRPDLPVSYCALCDGDLVRGRSVAVVGGANSAAQSALYLAPICSSVTLITHSPLKCDAALRGQLSAAANIKVLEDTEATPSLLDQFDHIFVYIGKCPVTSFLRLPDLPATPTSAAAQKGSSTSAATQKDSALATPKDTNAPAAQTTPDTSDLARILASLPDPASVLDADGFIVTPVDSHSTSIPGLFATGDVRAGTVHQVVTATGDGALASIEIATYLKDHPYTPPKPKTYKKPQKS